MKISKGSRLAGVVAIVLAAAPSMVAAQSGRAGVVTTVRGSAVVAREASASPVSLHFKDDVFLRDRITTGDRSVAQILLGGKAVVTVREHSQITVTEVPGTATLDIRAGHVAVAVLRHRMQPGESVEIRTPNAIAGVRGTVVVAEVTRPSGDEKPDAVATRITVLRGHVDVVPRDVASGKTVGPRVDVRALETIAVRGLTMPRAPQTITPEAARRLTDDFKVGVTPPPAAARAAVTEGQMREALAYASAMLPPAAESASPLGTTPVSRGASKDDGPGNAEPAGNGNRPDVVSTQTADVVAANLTADTGISNNGNGNGNGNGPRALGEVVSPIVNASAGNDASSGGSDSDGKGPGRNGRTADGPGFGNARGGGNGNGNGNGRLGAGSPGAGGLVFGNGGGLGLGNNGGGNGRGGGPLGIAPPLVQSGNAFGITQNQWQRHNGRGNGRNN